MDFRLLVSVDELRRKAEQGDAAAQNELGERYEKGSGVGMNYDEAVKWYRKSAEQGDAQGQTNLGFMYKHGYGVEQDCGEAVKWFQKSAEQRNASGQNNLGWMYRHGYGVKQDYRKAVKWYGCRFHVVKEALYKLSKKRFYRELCGKSLRVFSPRCGVFVTQGAQGLRVLREGRAVTGLEGLTRSIRRPCAKASQRTRSPYALRAPCGKKTPRRCEEPHNHLIQNSGSLANRTVAFFPAKPLIEWNIRIIRRTRLLKAPLGATLFTNYEL